MVFYSIFARAVVALALSTAPVLADTVSVSTLDWPPYTGSDLPKGGATSEVVRQAFAASGLDATVMFLPWKRAIATAKSGGDGVVAYFPGYHCSHDTGFVASHSFGSGTLGLVERADNPVTWSSLEDLTKVRVGTVLGYANTQSFDQAVNVGKIRTITSRTDEASLMKLLDGQIDAAVMDKFVFEYLRNTRSASWLRTAELQFNKRTLEDKQLYVCFRDDRMGRSLRDVFNAGLAKINPDKVIEAYFETVFKH